MGFLSFSTGHSPAVFGWFTVKSSFRKAPVVPFRGVGCYSLNYPGPGRAEVFRGLAPLVVKLPELLGGKIPGVVHGPGRHLEVGVEVALVLTAGGMDRHIHGHPEPLAEVESELPHCLTHLVAAGLMREGHRDRPGGGRILPPLRFLGGVP
jgi:hypothetical protein